MRKINQLTVMKLRSHNRSKDEIQKYKYLPL